MSQAFYSPIDRLAEQLPRAKGTGAEFMSELSKRPGYKPVEAEDRNLQTLAALPKMERALFLQKLKHQRPVVPETETRKGGDTAHDEYTLPGGSNYREILLQHPEGKFRGVDVHFHGAPNVLASIRAKDRRGPNGENILHLEEIQSDWHQQGRKKGYVPKGVNLDKEFNLRQNEWIAIKRKLDNARMASNMIDQDLASGKPLFQDPARRAHMEQRRLEYNNTIMDLMPQVMRAEDASQKAAQFALSAVPDAPYKKNWHELALKKMIHHAAERGYTHLAITPGAEQAKRYGLSRYLNSVSYRKSGDDNYHLVGKGKNDELVLPGHSLAAEDLHKFVGEELANKIRSTATNDPQHITGIGLDVGGEGMKGFYDKMVPDFLNKFGKKYGAQVQPMTIAQKTKLSSAPTPQHIATHHNITTQEWSNAPQSYRDDWTRRYAEEKQKLENPINLHSFPITPEMRKDVLANGLPLYAEGGSVKYSVRDDKGTEHPCNDFSHARNKAGNMISYKKTAEAHILEDGVPKWHWALGKTLTPVGHAKGGSVKSNVPRETVKAYKLFRVDKKQQGKMFPLFVDADTPMEMGKWIDAKEGEMSAKKNGKVKSKIGDLAYRPGLHGGDLPVATHIGQKDEEQKAEIKRITALRDKFSAKLGGDKIARELANKKHPLPKWTSVPRLRNANHVWTEVDMPNDVDWQSEATRRGYNNKGNFVAKNAHITDQLPKGGHYRYKTNSNMTGNWMIGGGMKINRILSDEDVAAINEAAGVADLPRTKPMDLSTFGFAGGGTVAPEEWMAEEHVNHKAKGGTVAPSLDQMRHELNQHKKAK